MTAPLLVLVLAAPVLLLAAAVVALWAHGPVGWLAAVGLVVGVGWATRWTCRCCWTWWQGTKAPELAPGQRPAGDRVPTAGTGPAAAAPPARPGGTSRG